MRPLPAALLLLITASAPGSLPAQVISGRLLDGSADRPVANAFVQLMNSGGARLAGAITDSSGQFSFRTNGPGEYQLRAERLGYETMMSPVLRLTGPSLTYDFTLRPQALLLPAVDARSEDPRGCERRPDGPAVYALWNAIRQALTVTAWSAQSGRLRFTMFNHERQFDSSMRLEREIRTPWYTTGAMPYSSVSADVLAGSGYLVADTGASWLLGLDADVLLSESFLNTHCFRLVGSADTTRIGLGFEPMRSDDRTDVSGVLWVDRRTAELERLTFEYRGLPDHMRRFGAEGEVRFRRLDNGTWIIPQWWVRSPLVGVARGGARTYSLLGWREDGGTVTSIERIQAAGMHGRGSGVVQGMVFDSISGRPLDQALVILAGTQHSALTNRLGFFEMRGIRPGPYEISVKHPALDELAVRPRADTVRVPDGDVIQHLLATPALHTVMQVLCPLPDAIAPAPPSPGRSDVIAPAAPSAGLMYGVVRNKARRETLAGVRVLASWRDGDGDLVPRVGAVTDGAGRYFLCRVPSDRDVHIRIESRDVREASVIVRPGSPVLRRDFN